MNGTRPRGTTAVRTGIADLDGILGGFGPGTLNVVASVTSMGKSALSLQIARSAARGATGYGQVVEPGDAVLYVSLDAPTTRLWIKHFAAESGIDVLRLQTGRLYGSDVDPADDEWLVLQRVKDELGALPLYTVYAPRLTVSSIRSRSWQLARSLQRDGSRLGLLVVDYLQLIDPDSRCEDRHAEINETIRGLDALARQLDVPILLLAQLDSKPEELPDKRPRLSDLRKLGDIEHAADTVTMIYRDDYYDPCSCDKGVAELLVRKNREGRTGTARVAWLPKRQFFGDLARDKKRAPRGREHV